jgi:hypothetical protein
MEVNDMSDEYIYIMYNPIPIINDGNITEI